MSKTIIDDSLVYAARDGDKSAMDRIVAELAPVVEIVASRSVCKGLLTRGDLIQEGMLGLLGAIYGYRSDGGASFKTYASVCIYNAIKNAVKKQASQKEYIVNSTISLDELDETVDSGTDPQTLISMQYGVKELVKLIDTELTELERDSLRLHVAGYNNRTVAEMISVSEKSVDNALQRARRKLKDKWIP